VAIYHFSVQLLQRSKGRSAIAAAAYRSASLLRDERSGQRHDYRGRRGVVWSGVLLPEGAPAHLGDRQQLWSQVEAMERRGDAQLAREINLALPRELGAAQRQELLLKFVQEVFVDHGMVADVAIHEPVPGKNVSPDNHHAHIMLALRRVTRAGLHRVKTREWNSRALLEQWRARWGAYQNRALAGGGRSERVDHRTLVVQRHEALGKGDRALALVLDREPSLHVGPRAGRIAAKGRTLSQERFVGPVRRRGSRREVARRRVDYRAIDKGSRAAQRLAGLQRVAAARVGKQQRLRMKLMRLRNRKVVLMRESAWLRSDLRRLIPTRQDFRWLETHERSWSLEQSLRDAMRRLARNHARSELLGCTIAEVERMLARMKLLHQPMVRQPQRTLGRVRARHPNAYASGGRGSGAPSMPGWEDSP
jgi:ATP-dependent exoDNAse (exonuclease V) alpha subunit